MDNLNYSNPSELWSKVLESLQKDFDKPLFERWLKPIRIKELRENEVRLAVRDEFFRSWVMDHYSDKIDASLKNLLNNPRVHVHFDIQEEVLNDTVKEPEASQKEPAPLAAVFQNPYSAATAAPSESLLNDRYTFESFVVGPSNRFAHAASMAVA